MARRFSDINRGPQLQQAFQNLQAYRSRSISERNATSRVGQRVSSPSVIVGIQPFGADLPTGITGYQVRSTERNRSQLGSNVGTHAVSPAPTTTIKQPGFLPAQVRLFVQTSTRVTTSAMTGIRYNQRRGQSYSYPFGQAAETDREWEIFNLIAAGLQGESANNKVSYRAEKFKRA